MSAPSVKRHDFDNHQEAELARWPGVTWTRTVRAKHYALVLTFGGVSRFVIYPTSPSDAYRGALNHVRDIRHTLTAMGATRTQERAASGPRRVRRYHDTPTGPIALSAQKSTRLGQDPFAVLAGLRIKPRRLSTGAMFLRFFARPQRAGFEISKTEGAR